MIPEETKTEIEDSLTLRHKDLVITISASKNGILDGRTHEECLKFAADVLLQETDQGSIENFLDTTISIQETLKEDFQWKSLDILEFMKKWRRRLYLHQIGEVSKSEEFQAVRMAVEPSSDAEIEQQAANATPAPDTKPRPMIDNSNHVTIGIPKIPVEKKEDSEKSSTVIEDKK